jgi:hypothetical protein
VPELGIPVPAFDTTPYQNFVTDLVPSGLKTGMPEL